MEMNFCRRCGAPLKNTERHTYLCENDHLLFANSSPTVGIWIVNENNEVLVATRGIEPHKGALDTIGGFVDEAESLEEAMRRELQEELGITTSLNIHYLTSGFDAYEYRGEAIPILNVIFWARVDSTFTFAVSDDVAKAEFIPYDAIPLDAIGQDSIRQSLAVLGDHLNN